MSSSSSWMQTYTGRQFWPLDPQRDDIAIEDIAHSLSNQCRFAGHCKQFYSVAQHSVLIARSVSPENALWALLHDASEAYLVDFPRPLKHDPAFHDAYAAHENRLMAAICERYGLARDMPAEVRHFDEVLLATEKRDLMLGEPAPWAWLPEPLSEQIRCWMPYVAKEEFLKAFNRLAKDEAK